MTLKKGCFVLRECLSLHHQITSRIIHSIYQDVKVLIHHSVKTRSAEEFGNQEAARRFGLEKSVIWCWRTYKAMIEKMPRKKKSLRGNSAKWLQLEERLGEESRALRHLNTCSQAKGEELSLGG